MNRKYTTITIEKEVKEELEKIIRETIGEFTWSEIFRKMIKNRKLTIRYLKKLVTGGEEEDIYNILINMLDILYKLLKKSGQIRDKELKVMLYITARRIEEKLRELEIDNTEIIKILEELRE